MVDADKEKDAQEVNAGGEDLVPEGAGSEEGPDSPQIGHGEGKTEALEKDTEVDGNEDLECEIATAVTKETTKVVEPEKPEQVN